MGKENIKGKNKNDFDHNLEDFMDFFKVFAKARDLSVWEALALLRSAIDVIDFNHRSNRGKAFVKDEKE